MDLESNHSQNSSDTNQPCNQHCGYIAIIGRPNVGKSTLLNHILQQKISITSRKPQTTRHQVLGIKTTATTQAIYVDTPGLHRRSDKALNQYMNRAASSSLVDVDLVLWIIEAEKWTDEETWILEKIQQTQTPVILVINKVDRLKQKERVLPFIDKVQAKFSFEEIVPISALKEHNLDCLETLIQERLPKAAFFYDASQITNRSTRFLVAERIREKLTRQLGDELPYALTVEVESYRETEDCDFIHAAILIERASQKAMVVGKQGQRLKKVGQQAREELETLLGRKIMLELWVKVREGWSDDIRALKSLGYEE